MGFALTARPLSSLEAISNQMSDDLGVGFRDELIAFFLQFCFQLSVVFNHSVVDDDQLVIATDVGVSIGNGGSAVSCPAGMADADPGATRMSRNLGRKSRDSSHRLEHPEFIVLVQSRCARAVVSAILQPTQTLKQEFLGDPGTNITNNPAHRWKLQKTLIGGKQAARCRRWALGESEKGAGDRLATQSPAVLVSNREAYSIQTKWSHEIR